MASDDNRIRRKWQHISGGKAAFAEGSVLKSFQAVFPDTVYSIKARPTEFQKIYINIELKKNVLEAIYSPPAAELPKKHGVVPDFVIENKKTSKKIYLEVKRQDGWVEGKKRKHGRGNAHERLCKLFTPGLLRILREQSKIREPALPFWIVFLGDITRDPCRVREITCWFEGFECHFFFWRDSKNPELLFKHFDERIAPLLD